MRVTLPVLPNGTRGLGPAPRARRVRGQPAPARSSTSRRKRLTLLRRGRVVLRAPVGIGAGSLAHAARDVPRPQPAGGYTQPAYGPVAFGTSARSPTLTDWPAGGFIGIHGTDRPDLVPGEVSHGCVRLRNPDMLRLARRMPVGTPVEIR